ncbi:acetyltransferase [Nonlabens ulvanivorans]|uniref:acetyltransferase n=1 Tax=Nonlabens ulvanivorans TaxID=906888 RepID=UPI002943F815|nr:acetyltransferase [Nonlabens ulvanivorans]WOI23102.1 acetyltransferase [Nonlabens ulvanivorans]
MIVIGSKGFAKEILEVILEGKFSSSSLSFFDNINNYDNNVLFDKFKILVSFQEVQEYFKLHADSRFTLGIGNPHNRKKLTAVFEDLGGLNTTFISKYSRIGSFDTTIGNGVQVMQGTVITNSVMIGNGCLINLNCTIGHDTKVGSFSELSPAVNVSGRCTIGDLVSLGTGAIVLPDITIGDNATIGAGAVVTENIPANAVAVGVPARVIKYK